MKWDRSIFLVTLPKEAAEEDAKKDSGQKKEPKDLIAIMETLYSSLSGLGYKNFLTFDIIYDRGLIKFFVAGPERMASYIEQQIHAEFPHAEIREVADYNIFRAQGVVLGTTLRMTKTNWLPIKTYKKIDADPTEGILNNLSKLKPEEGAAIQLIIKPAKRTWMAKALRVSRKMHKGEKLEEALGAYSVSTWIVKILLAPFKILGEIVKTTTYTAEQREKERIELKEKTSGQARTHQREEEIIKSLEEKIAKASFLTNINLVASAENSYRANQILDTLTASFAPYTSFDTGTALKERRPIFKKRFIHDFIYRIFRKRRSIILNTEELASLLHFPLPSAETPNILWLQARQSPPPVNLPESGLLLGETVYRGVTKPVYMTLEDRRRHLYIIGGTGAGKSTLQSNLIIQDIKNGEGVCVVDPHGGLIEEVLPHIPKERMEDVIYFDPSDTERPMGLNILEADTPEEMDFAVQEMIAIFYKLVTDPSMIGPMFEHQMRNAMLTLMADKEFPGTIIDIPRIFTDPEFQKYKLTKVTDPMVRAYWEKEMAKTSDFHKSEMLGYLVSKVGRFVENEMVRNIIGQGKSGFNLRDVMDNKKILLINLAKGKVGEMNSNLFGLIIVSKLQMAALARADMPEEKRKDFYLYIDEFQNFITDSIATILAEARKYRLDLIIAHQYIGQLLAGGGVEGKQGSSKIKDAIFGNVGTIVCFRIGVDDAETMAKQFAPVLNEYDVMNIDKFHAYVRLLINNAPSKPFTIKTIKPEKGDPQIAEAVKQLSRLKFGRDRVLVNAEILKRTKLGEPPAETTTE